VGPRSSRCRSGPHIGHRLVLWRRRCYRGIDGNAAGAPAFAKAVMYYPDCRGAVPWAVTTVSAMVHLGAIDEVAPPALCDGIIKRAPPDRLRAITYPNARHAFDLRSLPERTQYQFGTIGYNAEAAQASWATTVAFLK
jgi:dienelactone hydrolase